MQWGDGLSRPQLSQEFGRTDTYQVSRVVDGIGAMFSAASATTLDFALAVDNGDEILDVVMVLGESASGASANSTLHGLHLLIDLVQERGGTQPSDRILATRPVMSPRIGEAIRMTGTRSVDRDGAPIKLRITVLGGDETEMQTAIITLRYRRGN